MPSISGTASGKRATCDPTVALATRLAEQLVALRTGRGETQKQFAMRIGMTESMICRFERGDHLPSLTTLCRIAEGFDRRLEIAFLEIAFQEHEHHDARDAHGHGQVGFDMMHDQNRDAT